MTAPPSMTDLRNLEDCQRELAAVRAELATANEACERIAEQQPDTLKMIERNGFVFDSIGHEPGNWQHLAFTIYTHLCEVDTIARQALDALTAAESVEPSA